MAKKDEKLEHKENIKIRISVVADASILVETKNKLIPYAEELEWEVVSEKYGHVDEDGERKYTIAISPKCGHIAPEEFRKNVDKIEGIVFSLLGMIYEDDEFNENATFCHDITLDNLLSYDFCNILHVKIPIDDAIKLELESPNLFKKIFRKSLVEWYHECLSNRDKVFVSKGQKDCYEVIIKVFEDNGMPKDYYTKKHILKRLY